MKDSFAYFTDSSEPVKVETNASDYDIGVVLYQDGKPITFESKKLDSTQFRYTVLKKELFVVIHALKSGFVIFMEIVCGSYEPRVLEIFL